VQRPKRIADLGLVSRDLGLVSRVRDRLLVLVADDDRNRASMVTDTTDALGLESKRVASGEQVLVSVANRTPDLLVVSESLPILDGFELCRVLRHRAALARLPILMILSSGTEAHRLAAFEAGADECVAARNAERDVRPRLEQLLEHLPALETPSSWVYRGRHLTADFSAFLVRVDGRLVKMSRMELQLLRFLIRHAHSVVSRELIAKSVWGHRRPIHSRSLDVHIARLRSKLGVAGKQIETVVGVGYRFVADIPEQRGVG
jgi:two-component system phosphate regulon response regulator PhoB